MFLSLQLKFHGLSAAKAVRDMCTEQLLILKHLHDTTAYTYEGFSFVPVFDSLCDL